MYHNNKTVWKSTGIKAVRGNKRKAEERMKEILSAYEDNPHIFDKISFVDFSKKWLEEVKLQVDAITFEGYKQHLEKHIIPYFEPLNLNLPNVKITDIEEYYKYKSVSGRLDGKEGGLSHATIQRHGVVLNLIFNEAIRQSLIKHNPCELARIPNTAQKSEKKVAFYTIEQCKELLKLTEGTIMHDMIYVTFMYGLRRSELLGLKWDAVDFDNDTITIKHTRVVNKIVLAKDKTKSKSSYRTYPLLEDVKELLLQRKSQQEEYKKLFGDCYHDTGYIFAKEDGSVYYPDYPTKKLKKIITNNNLKPLTYHGLRHSAASMLFDRDWSMKDISEWLGHSNISITADLYTHFDLARKRKLTNGLDGILVR